MTQNEKDKRLRSAVYKGRDDIQGIKEALELGADPNTDASGENLLSFACSFGYSEAVEILLEAGANPNKVNKVGIWGHTPLIRATINNHIKPAAALLSHGANINARDSDGNSALHIAAKWNRLKFIECFISAGVDINAQNNVGENALHIAVGWNNREIIQTLVDAGININVKDIFGNTILMDIAQYGEDINTMEILIEGGADINMKNKYGDTALDILRHVHPEKCDEWIQKIKRKTLSQEDSIDGKKSRREPDFCL